ncbi:hypothetical protein IscW_ISCW006242 [Ixodes scapularis]|uniref:Uncharacterized protein n=1 Tax=Ixodes scapularis TaxID=6945 RepID=B7PN79_IXOSC|nr:hypothetical protein IscW_ISCW006242 [Ixodes scapularis]|eukprot:XP_002435227.1 hypothetical protein IscW_ISCW006242 [Ixodes scapularis]
MSEGAIRLLCRALADYACLPIQVHGSKVFHAPYCIGSGSYLTAHGNTWRHSFMADYVLDRLFEQGLITEEEEEYLRQFDVLGDDFRGLVIHRETAELFDRTIDQVFGTVTTTSTPPIFGRPNEGDSLEFLRRRHIRLGNEIRTFREPVRVLAKLFHGQAATSVARFTASLQAMHYDVGYNPWLHDILLKLIPAGPVNQAEYDREVERKIRKVPSMKGHPSDFFPSFNVCADADGSQANPALAAYAFLEADYAARLRLPHGEPNCRFMVPRINTHTQNIEAAWGPFKSFLVRKMKGSSGLGADTQQGQAKAYQILQRDLHFNAAHPHCTGTVTERQLKAKKRGFCNQMRCGKRDLRVLELNHGPNSSLY